MVRGSGALMMVGVAQCVVELKELCDEQGLLQVCHQWTLNCERYHWSDSLEQYLYRGAKRGHECSYKNSKPEVSTPSEYNNSIQRS